ncbi:MAG: hypothetical protein RL065_1940 [Bacteroidota bacterium]|jgi:cell division protein FtsW (lipid II flippase)
MKTKINNYTVYLVLFLLLVSAFGYLIAPEKMLSVVGIAGTKENNFLVKTLAAALLSFIPAAFAITRNSEKVNLKQQIIFGLALYMFLSSAVDLYGYLTDVVNLSSVPSIGFRVLLGIILIATNEKK